MKHVTRLVLLFSLLFGFSTAALAVPEKYTLDPFHSYVLWRISHFDFSHPTGKWLANGTLILDKDNPKNDKVDVVINVGDMITGIPELDKHLKSDLFFNVEKFPTATFVSNKVVPTGKSTADIYGMLTVHGVAKPIILQTRLNKAGISPITNQMTAGFSATAKLKRSDYGIMSYLPGLGDHVDLAIEVEAHK